MSVFECMLLSCRIMMWLKPDKQFKFKPAIIIVSQKIIHYKLSYIETERVSMLIDIISCLILRQCCI